MRFTLDSGLRVVLVPRHVSRVVALQALIDFGAADEPEELAGAAHLLEHLLLAGPGRAAIAALGGQGGAFTTHDLTVLHLSLAGRYLDAGLDLLARALIRPVLDERAVRQAAQEVLAEIRQAEDAPARLATQALLRAAFPHHPYGRPVLGTLRTVPQLDRARLEGLHRRHYGAGRVTLVLGGDLPPDLADVRARVARAFAGLPRGEARPRRPAEPEQDQPRAVAILDDHRGREAQLLFGFRLPPLSAEEAAALDLAAALLPPGDGSAYRHAGRDPGLFIVGAAIAPGHLAEAVQARLAEILRLGREELPQAELERARTLLLADGARKQETAAGLAWRLGVLLDAAAAYDEAVARMDPPRLHGILARLLVVPRLTVAALLPRAGEAEPRGKARLLLQAISPRDPAQARRLLLQVVERMQRGPAAGPPPRAPAAVPAGQVLSHRLPGGARVLVLADPAAPVVALQALWPGGQRSEDERTAGASQLLARLVSRGTRTRTADQVARELAAMGGTLRGVAGPSTFGLRLEVLARDWARGLELLVDCLRGPALSEPEVEAERRRLLIEIREREEDPAQVAHRLFLRALYPRHPYRLDPLGTPQSVAALTRRRLAEIYARRYPIERLTLAVVGAVDPAQLLRRAEALLPPAAAPAPQPEPSPMDSHPRVHGRYPLPESDPLPSAPLQVIKHGGRQQAHITAGFRGITLADPDRPALLLLTTLLSAPFGRLNAELRDRRGLVYGAAAASMEGADPGYLAIHLAASPEKAEAAQVALRDELRRLTDHEVAPEELARARRHLIGSLELSRQRPGDLAHALALSETCGPGWSQASRLADSIERVTAADVQRAARRYLDERHGVLAAVLPESPTPAASRRTVTEHQPEQRPAPPASARQAAPARKRGR